MKTTTLFAVLFVPATFAKPQPGLPFLLIWPTARSTVVSDVLTTGCASALVANDIAGGIRELRQGHMPWKE
jgi:hypothetical protein